MTIELEAQARRIEFLGRIQREQKGRSNVEPTEREPQGIIQRSGDVRPDSLALSGSRLLLKEQVRRTCVGNDAHFISLMTPWCSP